MPDKPHGEDDLGNMPTDEELQNRLRQLGFDGPVEEPFGQPDEPEFPLADRPPPIEPPKIPDKEPELTLNSGRTVPEPTRTDELDEQFEKLKGKIAGVSGTRMPEPPAWNYTGSKSFAKLKQGQASIGGNERSLGIALSIGYAFVGPVLLCGGVGAFIDHRVGGLYTTLGVAIGFGIGLFFLIKLVNRLNAS